MASERGPLERLLWRCARASWRMELWARELGERLMNLAWRAQRHAEQRRATAWGGTTWTGNDGIPF